MKLCITSVLNLFPEAALLKQERKTFNSHNSTDRRSKNVRQDSSKFQGHVTTVSVYASLAHAVCVLLTFCVYC